MNELAIFQTFTSLNKHVLRAYRYVYFSKFVAIFIYINFKVEETFSKDSIEVS